MRRARKTVAIPTTNGYRSPDAGRDLSLCWSLVPFAFMALMVMFTGANLQLHWGSPFLLFAVPALMELTAERVQWRRIALGSVLKVFVLIQLVLLLVAFTGITAFTNAPLRLWSAVGAGIAVLAVGYGCWIVIARFIYGVDVPGWATLVAGTMFLSGVQLLSIGILVEYVGRIFDEVKRRPVYVVATEAGQGSIAPLAAATRSTEGP